LIDPSVGPRDSRIQPHDLNPPPTAWSNFL
jgi:hypothetical protein